MRKHNFYALDKTQMSKNEVTDVKCMSFVNKLNYTGKGYSFSVS